MTIIRVIFVVFTINLVFADESLAEESVGPTNSIDLKEPAITSPPNVIPRTCTSTENVCPSCDFMAVCVDHGDGTFKTLLQQCRPNEKCVQGACVEGALCNQGEFSCKQEGYYPDLYDCTIYHVCLPLSEGGFKQLTYTCNGTSYDAGKRSCGDSIGSDACKKGPVPQCLERTQLGLVPRTKNYYYFCVERDLKITPELHFCPHNFEFNVEAKKCENTQLCPECGRLLNRN